MAWEDRDYYRSRESGGEYLGNPALFFGFSVPFGRWFGVPVRLSFWLLLTLLFMFIGAAHGENIGIILFQAGLLIGSLLVHDFGHRICAGRVGGSLNEFLLWPAGGMNHPTTPPAPLPTFIAHFGGMLGNLILAAIAAAGLIALRAGALLPHLSLFDPFGPEPLDLRGFFSPFAAILVFVLWTLVTVNIDLILVNLLPFYWFDGGYLLESILWPWINRYRAINVTCIIGMCTASVMFIFSLYAMAFLGMVYAALLFAGSFNKRRELKAGGAGLEESFAYGDVSYEAQNTGPARRKPRWPSRSAVRAATAERREQEKIDAILAKVHASGMQSLTWGERRTLSKATERQRRK